MTKYRVQTGTDPSGNPVYRVDEIPDNTAIPIQEAADRLVPKEKSTAELMKDIKLLEEAKKYLEPKEQPKTRQINQVRKFDEYLKGT